MSRREPKPAPATWLRYQAASGPGRRNEPLFLLPYQDRWDESASVDQYIRRELRQWRRWAYGAVVFLCVLIVILACSVVGPAR